MQKFVPFEKLSKKKQRELNKKQRGSWGGLNPVSRKVESAKIYNRKKARHWKDVIPWPCFLLYLREQYDKMKKRATRKGETV